MTKVENGIKVLNRINQSSLISIPFSLFSILFPEAAIGGEATEWAMKIFGAIGNKYQEWHRDIDREATEQLMLDFQHCINDTIKLLKQRDEKKDHIHFSDNDESILRTMFDELTKLNGKDLEVYLSAIYKVVQKIDGEKLGKINEEFRSAFMTCLFSYPKLNIMLIRTESDIRFRNMDLFIGNEFSYKLSILSNRDGIMKSFYTLFSSYVLFVQMKASTANFLSKVQDEYNSLFILDESHIRLQKIYANNLTKLLTSAEGAEVHESSDILIQYYLQYVDAEKCYYEGDYKLAIEKYTALLDDNLKEKIRRLEIPNTNECLSSIALYLTNSLAWAYELDGNKTLAIDLYRKFFEKPVLYVSTQFEARCRRNYGVCLEQVGKYEEAVEQYKKAIEKMKEGSPEFKVYITYCSSMMKIWDKKTDKISFEWAEKTRNLFRNNNKFLSLNNIKIMQTYLRIAEMKKSMFSDIYIQEAKLYIYLLLLADDENMKKQYEHMIEELLLFAETIAPGKIGTKFVRRDYYFAMSLLDSDAKQRGNLEILAIAENEKLEKRGDAKDFSDLFCTEK